MKNYPLLAATCGLGLLASCSDIEDALAAEDRIDTIEDCFPALYDSFEDLLDVAETFRLNTASNVPDPTGLTYSQQSDGSLSIRYEIPGSTHVLEMTLRFYDENGNEQNLTFTATSPLSAIIDDAATQLAAAASANGNPFMVGTYTFSDSSGNGAITGNGALTGVIGGTTNGNELERLITSESNVSGGLPAGASGTIALNTGTACSLTFTTQATTHLETDTDPTQNYPRGTLNLSVSGPKATVNASVTFDATSSARIDVDGLPGTFTLNLDTGRVSYSL